MLSASKVPSLLLSYTYFINDKKTAFVSVGFDTQDLTPKVILCNQKKHLLFHWNDWQHFFTNAGTIDQFFQAKERIPIENIYGAVEIKLKEKRGKKEVVFGLKKVTLNEIEWHVFFGMHHYINDVMRWYNAHGNSVSAYYLAYIDECVKQGTCSIDQNNILSVEGVNNFNVKRLHTEIPVLLKENLAEHFMNNYIFGDIQ